MEQKINTKSLVEAALMCGIMIIIVIITSYIPFLNVIGSLVLPIPIAIIYYKNDFIYSIGCIIVSIILTSMLFNPVVAITSGITYALVGIALGYCLKNKKKPYNTLVIVVAACIVSFIAQMWIAGIFIGNANIFQVVEDMLNQLVDMFSVAIEDTKNLYVSLGVTAAQIQNFDKLASIITIETLEILLPATIFLYSFFQGYISYELSKKILKKLNYKDIENLSFSEVYISNLLGAALIAIMSIGIITSSKGVSLGLLLYNATMVLTMIIMTINGVATVDYFLKRKMNMSKVKRGIIIGIVLIMGLFTFFSVIGFVEMMLDFRKLDPHRLRKV